MGMTVMKGRRGEQEKGVGGLNTNMPRWAHWRWGENVGSRHENTPIVMYMPKMPRLQGVGSKEQSKQGE